MKWIISALSICLIQVLSAQPLFAADKIKYGEWEIKMTVQGLPMQVPSQVERICLDKQHLVPGKKQTHNCNLKWQIQDTTVSWNISCSNGAKGTGNVVYHGETMRGSSVMQMPSAHVSLHSKITGKWVATECKAPKARTSQSSH